MPTVTWSSSVRDYGPTSPPAAGLQSPSGDPPPTGSTGKEEDLCKSSGILAWYSRQLVKVPVAVAMCIVLLLVTAGCGAVSLLVFDPPDFSEPTKGFEARGTEINARMLTYYNIYGDDGLNSFRVVNDTGQTGASQNGSMNDGARRARRDAAQGGRHGPAATEGVRRAKRDAPQGGGNGSASGVQFCHIDWTTGGKSFQPPAMVFEAVGSQDLFSRSSLVSLCRHDETVRASRPFRNLCCRTEAGSDEADPPCASSWSLGNFAALLGGRQACSDIEDRDVEALRQLLATCAQHYLLGSPELCSQDPLRCPGDVPDECLQHDGALSIIFHRLVPSDFSKDPEGPLASTILYLPYRDYYRDLYNEGVRDRDLDDGVTRLSGLGFGLLKFSLFGDALLSDTLYIGLGAGMVFLIVWLYTASLFVTLMTVTGMLMALVVAYFAFVVVFRLPFFPFVNVASAVLIIGVGADDTFVYVDIWRQREAARPGAPRSAVLRETLRHSTATMFVTSLTTASALYSTAVSSITAVRCFGVYAGTAVLVNFGLTLTWLPAVVVLRARLRDWWASLGGCGGCCVGRGRDGGGGGGGDGGGGGGGGVGGSGSSGNDGDGGGGSGNDGNPGIDGRGHGTATGGGGSGRGLCGRLRAAYGLIFQRYLPVVVLRLRYVWILLLGSLGAGAFCVVYVSPGLRLPNSAEFQVFRDDDLFERFDHRYKPAYDFGADSAGPLFLAAVFGLEAVDGGNHWDPDDAGSLAFLEGLDIYATDSQRWLLDFCRDLRGQAFYDGGLDRATCFMEGVRAVLEAPCSAGLSPWGPPCCGRADFPYPPYVFEACLLAMRTCNAATTSCQQRIMPGPLFSQTDGSLKAFLVTGYSTRKLTMEYDYIDDFWTEANAWMEGKLPSRPAGIKGGWMYAGSVDGQQLYFYNLQGSLSKSTPVSMALSLALAAAVLLLTTWNVLLSLYAVLSIGGAFCVTVGTLVLLGWRLNVFESAILTLAVGLSVDFTIHYGVAYRLETSTQRQERAAGSLAAVGSAITVAALSTFVAGAAMLPSQVLSYTQLGTFLMLVMAVSWVYATFFFLSLCRSIGPQGNCGQVPLPPCLGRRRRPDHVEDAYDNATKVRMEASAPAGRPPPPVPGGLVLEATLVGDTPAENEDAPGRTSVASAICQTDPGEMDAAV